MSGRSPEDLARAAGREAGEQEREAERWWSAVERGAADELPEGANLEALKPLDEQERGAMAADLFGAAPISIEKKRPKRALRFAAGMAIAASIALAVLWTREAPLPSYALDVRSGEQTIRAEDQVKSSIYTTGSLLELILEPAVRVEEDVEVQVVWLPEHGEARIWRPEPERSTSGALRIRATIGEGVKLEPGVWRMVVLVARPGDLPVNLRAAANDPPSRVQRFEHKVEVTKAASP